MIDRDEIQITPFSTALTDTSGGTFPATVSGFGTASRNRVEFDLRYSLAQGDIVYSFVLTR